ncbi:hypothetical protein KOI35_32435 [Actinoplanes bogorensis]|uniref:Uncharacterized protein n=1 Tax=Paractinoplanes bogorensis TaxID=1610840 RepID=A0ABS5YXS0_9ACTN|nr:hypothetical protein [Actinoplanes bogorensis]MBU2668230.1 hypothetical protein [Actinoplanes bogorensis]
MPIDVPPNYRAFRATLLLVVVAASVAVIAAVVLSGTWDRILDGGEAWVMELKSARQS